MSTIREWLNEVNFDWDSGVILWQKTSEDEDNGDYPGWSPPIDAIFIEYSHFILDYEFGSGYGGPKCPRFVARDQRKIYFPCQYDGSTWLENVWIDISCYLEFKTNSTPYPGS